MPSFFDLQRYAATGIASPDMTAFDKMRALAAFGGAVQTLTGQPPLTFKADGKPLISWSMKGNGSQTGTPTPDAPIMPEFVGTLDGADWTIPITCGGQTTPVYLGQTQTVRRVKKLVLTGEEYITLVSQDANRVVVYIVIPGMGMNYTETGYCNILVWKTRYSQSDYNRIVTYGDTSFYLSIENGFLSGQTLADFKAYLAEQYAAGTPVAIWYVLATPKTGIDNEPLCKIGDYADELSSADAGVSIPTAKGNNVLTIGTDLQPSEMTIKYRE